MTDVEMPSSQLIGKCPRVLLMNWTNIMIYVSFFLV
jgi:hypothetical protein